MTLLTLSLPTSQARPRFSTRRTEGVPSFGGQIAAVASALGWELLPWQRLVADVAGEVNPDGTWRYPTVIVTTPRQSGKSTLIGSVLAHRAIRQKDSLHWYTAQAGKDANETWRKWEYKLGEAMPGRWGMRYAQGTERAHFTASNGVIRPFAPTPKSLHGQQSDTVVLDECWAYSTEQGEQLLQAVIPTQATRPMRQLWIVSTAGTENSTWFRSWIKRGREAVEDPDAGIAYFEWSAPDDADPEDPEVWRDFHPGYGSLIDDHAMSSALDQFGLDGFSRGYLNRWPTAAESWRAGWPMLATAEGIPEGLPVFLAADASLNQRHAAIGAAALLPDGRISVEVIDARPGTAWLGERLQEIARRHRAEVIIGSNGPLAFLIEELTRAGVRVSAAGTGDYAAAGDRFRTLVMERRIAHQADPRLDMAVDAIDVHSGVNRAVWRRSRGAGDVDVSPLIAVSFAAWKAATPPPKPQFIRLDS
jgi:hypothetical protein